ncbi:uncharacterized protein LOC144548311 [Carex rostrata]
MPFDVKDLPDLVLLEEERRPDTTQVMDLLLSLSQETPVGDMQGFGNVNPPSPMLDPFGNHAMQHLLCLFNFTFLAQPIYKSVVVIHDIRLEPIGNHAMQQLLCLLNFTFVAQFSSFARSLHRRLLSGNSIPRIFPRCLSTSSSEGVGATTSAAGYNVGGGTSFMRGVVFYEPGRPLSIEEFKMPRPKAGEVLIKTKGCGVCHSDLHVMKGELPFPSPCVIGHEITGEVVEHGAHTDNLKAPTPRPPFQPSDQDPSKFPIGSQVVGAFIMPCGNCFYCVKGQEDLCEAFFAYNRAKGTLYDGETRLFLRNGKPVYMYSMGGLAEYCVVPANALAVLPKTLPYTESAILGCAVFTAYGAMRHAAEMRAGDSVAVIGVGGVGSRFFFFFCSFFFAFYFPEKPGT